MKRHAIIPVFIPHRGCPNDCVFCNQKAITARSSDVSPEDVRNTIETYLPTLTGRGLETIEVAFFGGSLQPMAGFTRISPSCTAFSSAERQVA